MEALFSEVYDEWTPRIKKQYEETMEHISKYPNEYPVGSYKMWKKEILDIAYVTPHRSTVRCLEEINCPSQILREIPELHSQM